MCLRADATTSAIHVRLILPGECHGDYPPRLCHTPFTRIWPYEELCRFNALVDNPWKWCASCWRKIAVTLIDASTGSERNRLFSPVDVTALGLPLALGSIIRAMFVSFKAMLV